MDSIAVAEYLETLASKIRAGTHTVEVERTEYYRAVIQEVHNEEVFEIEGEVDDSVFRELLKISRISQRSLS